VERLISTDFYYNGVSSESMGLSLIRLNSGIFPVPYVPARDIIEEFPTMAKAPYVFKSKQQQYTINAVFSTLTNDMTPAKLKTLATWLFQEDYKEFYTEDEPDKIFYLFATNQVDFMTNGANEGYFEVQFKSKFPYALTTSATPTSTITGSGTIVIDNLSNAFQYYYPEIEITVNSGTSVSFTNTSDSNRVTSFSGLTTAEVLYVNNEKKQLVSSTANYRYDGFNKNWLRLVQGVNTISVTGNATIEFRTQFPVFT
jgi:phage-related protein